MVILSSDGLADEWSTHSIYIQCKYFLGEFRKIIGILVHDTCYVHI